MTQSETKSLSTTGSAGLDNILNGGFTPHRLYLIEGDPGAGKTTLALRYLLDGQAKGEKGLYVTLSETREELTDVARSHGWNLGPLEVFEMTATEEELTPDSQYTMYHPSETELAETTKDILEQVERIKPQRVVIDSLSELRLLAQNPLRYRRQILALKQFFNGRNCTVLLLDDRTTHDSPLQVRSIAHGVLLLEHLSPEYGADRRRLRVMKMRGRTYRGGFHDFNIITGGLDVFPRLIAAEHHSEFPREKIGSGIKALDALLDGGLDRGTSTLMMGPAGSGKSTLAIQYAAAAAERGDNAAIFLFDESRGTLLCRCGELGIPLEKHLKSGRITIQQIDPAELSPGEFAHIVRKHVEERKCRVIVIDSLNGYLQAMPEERFMTVQLHELLTYLGQKGVTTLLVVAQHGLMGASMQAPIDLTYLADAVILTRFFELRGRVKKALSVVKKRAGAHEETIRELKLGPHGVTVGEPLENLRGIMTGVPVVEVTETSGGRTLK